MSIQLTAVQRRVLGVLIEKSMTTPGSYPMTLNAIVTGCNQLTCREPVMSLGESDVSRAVYDLQQMMLIKQADPDRTARANRFQHQIEQRFGWEKRERALMAELLLRGPQTIGELRQNASRMAPIEDIQIALNLVAELSKHEPPWIVELSRQPGRSVTRFDHLFYMDDEPREAHAAEGTAPQAIPRPESPGSEAETLTTLADLQTRVSRLETEMDALRKRLDGMTPAS